MSSQTGQVQLFTVFQMPAADVTISKFTVLYTAGGVLYRQDIPRSDHLCPAASLEDQAASASCRVVFPSPG